MAETYRSALTQADLISGATVVCNAGQYNKLGEYKILAGEVLAVGFGPQSGMDNAQGRIYADLRDNAAAPGVAVNGMLRLEVYSPKDRPMVTVFEFRTEVLRTSAADRTKQIPLPEGDFFLSEDKKYVLSFKPDATVTIGKANTFIILDTTEGVA
jgi:hypothetical protein